jgi:monoterpene epsilon-lactone hydrolase
MRKKTKGEAEMTARNAAIYFALVIGLSVPAHAQETPTADMVAPVASGGAAEAPAEAREEAVIPQGNYKRREGRWKFPWYVSDPVNTIYSEWVPFWLTDSGAMPGPDDYEGWLEKRAEKNNIGSMAALKEQLLKDYKATINEIEINGVRILEIVPEEMTSPDSVVIYTHPGGMYAQTADGLLVDALPMAVELKARVYNVDYTKIPGPPKGWSYKDQIDEFIGIYRNLIEEQGVKPENVGWYSCSAGSSVALAAVNEISNRGLPMFGAFSPNAGVYDWNVAGDTWLTLEGQDPVVSSKHYIEPLVAMMKIDPTDPLYSPVYDDYEGREWPPTMFFVGSREAMASDSFRMNQLLKYAGHDSEVVVFDGVPHCWASIYYSPEAEQYRKLVADFMREKGVLTGD